MRLPRINFLCVFLVYLILEFRCALSEFSVKEIPNNELRESRTRCFPTKEAVTVSSFLCQKTKTLQPVRMDKYWTKCIFHFTTINTMSRNYSQVRWLASWLRTQHNSGNGGHFWHAYKAQHNSGITLSNTDIESMYSCRCYNPADQTCLAPVLVSILSKEGQFTFTLLSGSPADHILFVYGATDVQTDQVSKTYVMSTRSDALGGICFSLNSYHKLFSSSDFDGGHVRYIHDLRMQRTHLCH